jgi:hypothetical protein
MKNLSSPLTFAFKYLAVLWIVVIVVVVCIVLIMTHSFWGLALLVTLIPFVGMANCYQIKYDDKNIYIKKWVIREEFNLAMIKSINEGELFSWDPFFQLEVMDEDGTIRKVNFMPDWVESLDYLITKRYVGQLLDFKIQLRNVRREQSLGLSPFK